MGYTNNDLIPPAILLDNPGLTRERFLSKLQGVKFSDDRGTYHPKLYKRDDALEGLPWNLSGCKSLARFVDKNDTEFYRLAEILRLDRKQNFVDRINSLGRVDELLRGIKRTEGQHIRCGIPGFYYQPHEDFFRVTTFHQSILNDKTKFGKFNIPEDICEGDVITGYPLIPFEYSFVEKFVKDFGRNKKGERVQTVKLRKIEIPRKEEYFKSLDEFVEVYPYFHYDFMYDFSQTSGRLDPDPFTWRKENERYFLDLESLKDLKGTSVDEDGMPCPIVPCYTNLILTAEAIRHKAWKVLSAYGLSYMNDFLKDFPSAKRRYDFAVDDSFNLLPLLTLGKISGDDFARQSKSLFYEHSD